MFVEALHIRSLTAGYTAGAEVFPIIEDFTTTVEKGTFTCVLGNNGAGKSTLLRTLSRLQRAISGSVVLGDCNMMSLSLRDLAKTVGVVLTDRRMLATRLTVKELVGMGRIPYTGFYGTLSKNDLHIVDEALDIMGIGDFAERRIAELSDGECQKAMIAKTLAQQTPVILLDEPTAFLDFPSETETFCIMRNLAHNEGKTVVCATHNLNMAMQTADNMWVLERGEKAKTGTPHELAESGALDIFFKGKNVSFNREKLSFHIDSDE